MSELEKRRDEVAARMRQTMARTEQALAAHAHLNSTGTESATGRHWRRAAHLAELTASYVTKEGKDPAAVALAHAAVHAELDAEYEQAHAVEAAATEALLAELREQRGSDR